MNKQHRRIKRWIRLHKEYTGLRFTCTLMFRIDGRIIIFKEDVIFDKHLTYEEAEAEMRKRYAHYKGFKALFVSAIPF